MSQQATSTSKCPWPEADETKKKTIGELSRELGVSDWKVPRVSDALALSLQRVGLYRLLSAEAKALIREALQRTGWLASEAER